MKSTFKLGLESAQILTPKILDVRYLNAPTAGNPEMTPWIADANDLQPKEVSKFKTNLLHPTRRVEAFLEIENREATIVVAPKGFGKTLLLMAKRLSLQGHYPKILPLGQSLVDKPSGSPSVIVSSEYGDIRDEISYWKNVWLISLGLIIAKNSFGTSENLTPFSRKIIENPDHTSACDVFDVILTSTREDYYKFLDDHNDIIMPKIRNIDSQIAMFIDNIDEYFGETYSASFDGKSRHFGELKDSFWYLSQLGLALSSREINRINKHVKIFISMRKEVLQKSIHMGSFWTQLKGKCIDIEYTNDDIKHMIQKNIESENKKNLVNPYLSDPMDRFVGEGMTIVHPTTGDEEDFLDFWVRHTLNRPRDVISIGREISLLKPEERTPARLSKCVRSEAASLVRAYMYEMQPHLPGFDPDLICRLIPSNTLNRNDLDDISKNYAKEFISKYSTEDLHTHHIFCALFKIGILGYIAYDVDTSRFVQVFRQVGEDSLDEAGVIPNVDRYVIHPSLDNLIGQMRPKYFENLNRYNVIGQGRVWRSERAISYIIKGDVKGYSQIMKDPTQAEAFSKMFESALKAANVGLDYAEITNGDSVTIIDRNPVSAISAAREIALRVFNSEFKKHMRFGGHAGFISITSEGGIKKPQGYAIRTAARIEEVGVPGHIIVSEKFIDEMRDQFENPVFGIRALEPGELPNLHFRDGEFNVAKSSGYDEATWMKLFSVFRD